MAAVAAAAVAATALAACLDVLAVGLGVPRVIVPGDTVTGEMEHPGDIKEHYLRPSVGERWVVFFAAAPPPPGLAAPDDSLRLEITTELRVFPMARVRISGSDTRLLDHATDPVETSHDILYILRVTSQGYVGSYRFVVHRLPLGTGPEAGEPTVPVYGEVMEASIDPPGDADAFPFVSQDGQSWNVYFQALSGSFRDTLLLTVVDSADRALADVESAGTDPGMEGQTTGRFQPARSGTYRVMVKGKRGAVDTGPYRFLLWRIDP